MSRSSVLPLLALALTAATPVAALARPAHRHRHARVARAVPATLYDYAGEGNSCVAGATGGDLLAPTPSNVAQMIMPAGGPHAGQLRTSFALRSALPSATYYLGAGNDADGCDALAGTLTTDAAGNGGGVIYTAADPAARGYFAYVIHPEPYVPPDPGAIMVSTLVRLSTSTPTP